MASKTNKTEEKQVIVSSIKEFKDKYLPKDSSKEIYQIDDPKKLGIMIAEKIYEKNKHVLFGSN